MVILFETFIRTLLFADTEAIASSPATGTTLAWPTRPQLPETQLAQP
jgi:hypothetical protein